MLLAVAVFAPLFGALVAGLLGRAIGDRAAQAVTILCMLLASVCGVVSFVQLVYGGGTPGIISLGTWIEAGDFHVDWALRADTLSSVMVAMVTCVATLIHIYSVGYMSHDRSIARFFSYLSLFTFAMLMLVTADNLLQLFFGWEGVGLASYLLIGFWYDRPAACAAAMKAFIVNRIGDLGFAVGIALVFSVFGSIEFSQIFATIAQHQATTYHLLGSSHHAYEVIGVLLFIGAMGKSAQLGLHVWLPDAMEGPTPVSALIHAATMVTAGVFLMARMSPLLDYAPGAMGFVTFIGASTCFFAATVACCQTDIKRVIAYSTCSQLGYMFVAAGVGAYQASIFHLLTHAFFKALLFLSAGSVIHAMSNEQDMRRMGGIWRMIPITYAVMWIGNLALAGIPPFAGYYSKDAILEAAWASHSLVGHYGFWLGLVAAFLTAFYSWRLMIMTFHGTPRADHHTMEHVPALVSYAPTVVGVLGIATAYLFYMFRPGIPVSLATRFAAIYRFLLNKWYFDELYDTIFVQPALRLSRALWATDGQIIDGIPNGVAALTAGGSSQIVKLQTGSIAQYAFVMLIGLVALVSVFLIFR